MSKIKVYKNDDSVIVDSEKIIDMYDGTSFLRLIPDVSDEVHVLFAAYEKYKHLLLKKPL